MNVRLLVVPFQKKRDRLDNTINAVQVGRGQWDTSSSTFSESTICSWGLNKVDDN